MRLGLYGNGPEGNTVYALLSNLEEVEIHHYRDWHALQRSGYDVRVLVLVILSERRQDLLTLAGASSRRLWRRSIVLVTDDLVSVARDLHHVPIDELVTLDELKHLLPAAVRRAAVPEILDDIAHRLDQVDDLSEQLRSFVSTALGAPTPFCYVSAVLRHLDISAGTLNRHWNRHLLASHPKEFIDWIILVTAVYRKAPGSAWCRIAAELSVSRNTLSRIAHRRMDSTLSDLQPKVVYREFDRYVLRTFLNRPST